MRDGGPKIAKTDPTGPPGDLDTTSKHDWRKTRGQLREQGTWKDADAALLERYIRSLQRAREAREYVKDEGLTALGSQRQLVEHPGVKTEREALRDAHRYADSLLLTPKARSAQPSETTDDEFERAFGS